MMFSDAMNSRGAASRDGGAAAPLSRGAGAATCVQFAGTISWLMQLGSSVVQIQVALHFPIVSQHDPSSLLRLDRVKISRYLNL